MSGLFQASRINQTPVEHHSSLARQRIGLLRSTAIVAVALATSMALAPVEAGAQQFWDSTTDGNAANNGTVDGGSGDWDAATTPNFTVDGGTTNQNYANPGNVSFSVGGGADTVTVVGTININDIDFQATGYTLTGGTLNTGAVGRTITVGGASATISSIVDGTGGLTKQGAGNLTLSGVNTYSGGTIVSAGTLTAGVAAAFGAASNDLQANGGTVDLGGNTVNQRSLIVQFGGAVQNGTLNLSLAGLFATQLVDGTLSAAITGVGGLTKANVSTATLSGNNTYAGGTNLTAGTLIVGHNNALGTGALAVSGVGATLQIENGVNIGTAADLQANANFSVGAGNTGTYSGVIGQTGNRSLTKTGAGNLILSVANTYTGGTIVSAGTLTLGNAAALGGNTGNGLQVNGGTVDLGGNVVSQTTMIVQSGGAIQNGTINLTSGAANATQLLEGTISANIDGAGGLVKSGPGIGTLSGNNTYAGGTNLTAGTLIVGHNNALGAGALAVSGAGATLQIENGVNIGTAADLQANANFSVGAGNTGTYSGNIGETGAQTLTKTGTGNLILSGTNTFTGLTTISGGTLTLASAGAVNNVTVANGGTLSLGIAGAVGGTITTTGSTIVFANGVNNAAPIVINSNTTDLQVNGADSAEQSGVISELGGSRPLSKTGTGTLVLSNTNTYTGTTTVTAGTLDITGSIASTAVVVDGGAILQVDGASLLDTASVTLNGNGILNIVTAGETIGLLGSLSATSSVANNGNTLTLNGDGTPAIIIATFGGNISGAGGLTVNTGNDTQILSGVNTYTGATTVNGGVLEIGATGSILNTSAINIVGGALRVDGAGGNAINDTLAVVNAGTFELTGSDETIGSISGAGNIVLGANTLTLASTSTLDGVVSGSGDLIFASGVGNSINNAGNINTYSGFTTIANGTTLTATTAGSLGSTTAGGVTVDGILNLGGAIHTKVSAVVNTGATLLNGTLNVTGFFGSTGTIDPSANVNATGYALTATGGTINALGTFGINATNAGAITLTDGGSAPAIVSANDGINLASTAAGDVTVTTGNDVNGGNNGIVLANSVGGNVSLTLGGNVGTTTGDAIQITSTVIGGTVSVTGTGNVTAQGGVGSDGIQINSAGDTTVAVTGNIEGDPGIVISSGAGNILVNGVGSVVGALQAMNLDTTTGNIVVTQNAATVPGIQGGTIGIDANSTVSGNIDISGIGNITGQGGEGVLARTAGTGTISVNHYGVISGSSTGVDARTTGTGFVAVTAQLNITGTAGAGVTTTTTSGLNTVNGSGAISGGTFGINAQATAVGGSVNILRNGTGTTTSTANGSTVINAQVTAGNGTVSVNQSVAISNTAAGAAASHGVNATNVGTGSVSVAVGSVTLNAASIGTGINATSSGGGDVSVSSNAILGGAIGINASTTLGGTVTVAAGSVIGAGVPPTSVGIQTSAVNGVSLITLNGAVTAGVDGVNATSTGTGNIIITGNGAVTGGAALGSEGIQTSATSSATVISVDGVISGNVGIDSQASAGGNLSVIGTGNVTSSSGEAIRALSTGGNGIVNVNRNGIINGATNGISARSTNGGAGTGAVTVTAQQNVTGGLLAGVISRTDGGQNTVTGAGTISGVTSGIDAQSATGAVTVSGTGATSSSGAASTTLRAVSTNGGNVSVTRSGLVSNTGTGATTGIFASATGSGTVTVSNQAGILVNGAGSAGTGIATFAVDGVTLITLNVSDVSSTGDGIRAVSTSVVAGANAATAGSGGITIAGFGNVTGDSDGSNTPGQDGLDLTTAAGDISVTLVGDVSGDPGIVATSTLGGDITIAGSGDVTGTLAEGILASTTNGNGIVSIARNGVILGATTGVDARSTNGVLGTGTVTVNALQNITGTTGAGVITRTDTVLNTVTGVGAISGATFGIDARSLAAGGSVLVTGTGTGTTSATAANSTAIKAQSTVGNGNVTVTRTGTITNSGAGGDGIDADATGTGDILITSGVINLTNAGPFSNAIDANQNGAGAAGTITINSIGAINVAGSGVSGGIRTLNTTIGTTDINVAQSITLSNASIGSSIQMINNNAGSTGVNTIDTTVGADINGGRNGILTNISGVGSIAVSRVTVDGNVGNISAPTNAGVTSRTQLGSNIVQGSGSITGVQFGIDAQSVDGEGVQVLGNGTTTASGAASTTINARSGGIGTVVVNRTGLITNTGTGGTFGIFAQTTGTGDITVTNTGGVNIAGDNSFAIAANQIGGPANINISGTGAIVSTGTGSSTGIGATNDSAGQINITSGVITLNALSTGGGIVASSTGGGNLALINNGAINGGDKGIFGTTNANGNVTVTSNAAIGNTLAPTTAGVEIRTVNGIATLQGAGNISGGAFGIDAQSTATAAVGGSVTVTGAGTTTSTGAGSSTIFARSNAMNGNVVVNRIGAVVNTGAGATFGILGASTGTGSVTVTNTGGVTIAGAGSFGVSAGHGGGVAANVVINGAGAVVSTGTGNSIGVAATNDSAGSINVTTGAVTMAAGSTGAGIFAQNSGTGSVTVLNNGAVVGGAVGINAASTTGAVAVTTGANVTGLSGSGITVASTTGVATINIGAGHTVTGGTTAITSSAGTTTANIAGTLNSAGGAGSAFTVTAGTFALTNAGTAFGAIQSSAGTTTSFTNNAGATWNVTNATSTLAGVSDTIQNDGTLVSTGTVNFNGVENFNNTSLNTLTVNGTTTIGPNVVFTNTGRISMQDGAIDDRLNINGTFVGAGASTLDVDIDLSRNNPGGLQLSDIMVVRGGPVTGATTVNFNVLAGTPTLQDAPIIVVDVDPAQANTGVFVDTNGTLPAAGNIIEYKLVQAANGDWVVNSVLNTAAIGSVSGSVQSTLSVIGAVVNRPSSPFVASPIAPDADTCAPGTWGRGTGGRAVVDSKSGVPGAASRDAISTKIGYKGFQGGVDFGCFNISGKGFDIATGLTGGFNNGTSSTRLPTSLTSSSFESKYLGGYASFQKGAFFADIQGRADYSDFKLNNSTVGLNNVKVKSERFSLTGTAAYSIEVPVGEESYNLVPAIGGSYAHSNTDTVMFADGSTLKLKDQTDILGFAGITVNRVFVTGGDEEDSDLSAYIPFATVTMYNEFGDTPSSLFTDSSGTQRVIDSQNLGLYAEFSAGVNYRKIFTSETSRIREIAASVRGDYKFGQRVQAVGITAQIRFQF